MQYNHRIQNTHYFIHYAFIEEIEIIKDYSKKKNWIAQINTFMPNPCHEPLWLIRQGLSDARIWPNQMVWILGHLFTWDYAVALQGKTDSLPLLCFVCYTIL